MINIIANSYTSQETTASKLQTITFYDQKLTVLKHNEKPYVAMKPICENIGLEAFDFQKYNRYIGIGAETTSKSGTPQPIFSGFFISRFYDRVANSIYKTERKNCWLSLCRFQAPDRPNGTRVNKIKEV